MLPVIYKELISLQKPIQYFLARRIQSELIANQILNAMGIGDQQAVIDADAANVFVAA